MVTVWLQDDWLNHPSTTSVFPKGSRRGQRVQTRVHANILILGFLRKPELRQEFRYKCLTVDVKRWILFSYNYCSASPQALWLKTTKMFSLTAVEVKSPKSESQDWNQGEQSCALSKFPTGGSFHYFFQIRLAKNVLASRDLWQHRFSFQGCILQSLSAVSLHFFPVYGLSQLQIIQNNSSPVWRVEICRIPHPQNICCNPLIKTSQQLLLLFHRPCFVVWLFLTPRKPGKFSCLLSWIHFHIE